MNLNPKSEALSPKQYQNSNVLMFKTDLFGTFEFGILDLFRI